MQELTKAIQLRARTVWSKTVQSGRGFITIGEIGQPADETSCSRFGDRHPLSHLPLFIVFELWPFWNVADDLFRTQVQAEKAITQDATDITGHTGIAARCALTTMICRANGNI